MSPCRSRPAEARSQGDATEAEARRQGEATEEAARRDGTAAEPGSGTGEDCVGDFQALNELNQAIYSDVVVEETSNIRDLAGRGDLVAQVEIQEAQARIDSAQRNFDAAQAQIQANLDACRASA